MSRRNQLLVLALLGVTGCGHITVEKLDPKTRTSADGVIYALPNTVVRVALKIDKTEKTGAKFAPFAPIFVPGSKPVCKQAKCTAEEETTFSVEDGATFTTYGEPDPDNLFIVKFSGGGVIDQSLSMAWNETGLLSSASSTVTNRTIDVVLSGVKLAAGVGTKLALGAAAPVKGPDSCPSEPSSKDGWVIPILRENAGDASQELIENYCSLKKLVREELPKDDALLKSASIFYGNRIAPLANARARVITGDSPAIDAAGVVTKLDAEIDKALTTAFLGSKKVTTWDGVLDVRTLQVTTPITILRIVSTKGVCLASAEFPPTNKPLPDGFLLAPKDCTNPSDVTLAINYYPEETKQIFSHVKDIETNDRSFRYRIPAQVVGQLLDSKKSYGTGVFTVAQLGTIVSLPASQSSKALTYELGFVEATGALKTFKLGTTGGLDSATIDALAGVGGTLADYRAASRKSEDELTTLTRQDQLLKLKDDICTIQKKYGVQCLIQPD